MRWVPAAAALMLLACANTGRGAPPQSVSKALGAAPAVAGTTDIAVDNPNAALTADTDVAVDAFCVTCGSLQPQADGRALVESPKMRAVVDRTAGSAVTLDFTYLGPTRMLMALSSGLSRVQVGLKLFAHDACNLVYVMWRLHPKPGIVVSTKRNLGMRQSSGCGNQGYKNLRPTHEAPTPPVAAGMPHRLRVRRTGAELQVWADEVLAWQGQLDTGAPETLTGSTGVRSDNGRYIFKLQLSPDATRSTADGSPCAATESFPHPEE